MPRGSYAKVSAADRARIVECGWQRRLEGAVCKSSGQSQNGSRMGQKWCKERRPHTGSRRKALMEEQVDAICGMIEEDQGITVKGKNFGGLPIERSIATWKDDCLR